MKPDSNYNMGMKPLVYSVAEAEQNQIGWHRDGTNIGYYQSFRKKKSPQTSNAPHISISSSSTAASIQSKGTNDGYGPNYYALTFEIKFKHDRDTVYFAHCYPYTYTDQCEFITK